MPTTLKLDPDELLELLATCKADAIANPKGEIHVVVDVHLRTARRKCTLTIDTRPDGAAKATPIDLSALMELCGKLRKDKTTTILVAAATEDEVELKDVLLDNLRLRITDVRRHS